MSSSQIKTYIVSFSEVTNNGVKCQNPIIEPAGGQDIAMNCIDPDGCVYKVQVGPNDDNPCLYFIVQCEECDDCGPVVIEKCFCEDQDDCKDCEICGNDGFCEKLCDKCCDGECCDCETDADCPCNKECRNGSCVCPPGTTENANGCCDECQNDGDCPVCHECKFKNGYLQCIPLDCPCDPDGRCGARGQCVECLTSGDCDGVNECCIDCECDCCPGYTRINGVCVECECQSDSDCDLCEECSGCGCRPQTCPPGKVPTVLNGQCVCVEECDCEDPDCSSRYDYCDPTTVNRDLCGCIPCEGSCASGCVEPCICDPIANKCVFNPCQGDCVNGTDCPGRDCGCLNGKCVPCFLLDCTQPNSDCEGALGCECSPSQKCGPAGCPPTPCSVASDCPFGCTCYEGICVSCDNFSCKTNDCKNQPGCGCVGDSCEGLEEDCADTLTLEKDDDDCSLTGTLIKQECCQCPALTMDARGGIISETETHYAINFVAEVRKGQYTGGPVTNIPKLDNYTNKNIANNEPPRAGSVFMAYEIFYDIWEIIDGVEVRTGEIEREENSSNPVVFPDYNVTPEQPISPQATASLNINGFSFPKIGARFQSGNIVRYVRSVDLAFFLSADLQFHNTCRYKGNVQFADYSITKDQHYKAFPVTSSVDSFGNDRAENITSDACRYPFFKWYKSDTNSFGDIPFRKLYIPPTAGNAKKYEDILTTREQGLESCKYYLLETDCTCQGPVSDYIVFCNPEDIDDGTFTGNNILLRNCNTILELYGPFIPCDPNEDETYYIEAGSIYVEFGPEDYTGKTAGQLIIPPQTSSYEIEEVVYGIVCDTQGECTKTYPVENQDPEINITTDCPGNGTISVLFAVPDGGGCAIAGINIYPQGTTSGTAIKSYGSGNRATNLPTGHYTAVITWACGCDPTIEDFGDDCCGELVLSDCFRDCISGEVSGCIMEQGVTYYDGNGSQLSYPSGLKDYISAADLNESVVYTAQKGDCDPVERTLGAIDGDCCDDYDIKIEPDKFVPTKATVTVTGGISPSLTVDNGAVKITPSAQLTPSVWTWELIDIPEDTPSLIEASDPNCGDISLSYLPGGCLLDVQAFINPEDCSVVGAVDVQECECPNPVTKVTINAVASDSTTYTVTWSTEFMPVDDADPTAGTIQVKYTDPTDGVTQKTDTYTGVNQSLKQTTIYKPGLGVTANFQVIVKGVTTEDNCKFADASTNIPIASGAGGESRALKLTPKAGTSLDRTTKFTWNRYNIAGTSFDLTYIDYGTEDTGVELSIMPINFEVDGLVFLEQGREYRLEAECVCKDAQSFTYCCLPDISVTVNGCNNEMEVTLTGLDGNYVVKYGGIEYDIVVSGGGGNVIIPAPLMWSVGEYYPVGASNCRSGFSIDLAEPCEPSVSADACVGDTFALNVTGCSSTSHSINVISGSYSTIVNAANGWVITGVDRNDPVEFTVESVISGCITTVETTDYTPQCLPDATPSPTPTVSASLNSSPSPTPTRTPSRSPGASPDATPSTTPTRSVTPTTTPSISITPSVTGTPGASPTPTPSGSPANSPTPTRTATPTITPTRTKTPSVTPSITPTKTPTKTVTKTPTPTRSITPTRTVTPSKSSSVAYCGGSSYDPLTRQCCITGGGEI